MAQIRWHRTSGVQIKALAPRPEGTESRHPSGCGGSVAAFRRPAWLAPDPHLLVNAYITREAVSSSRIEGTQASVTEVFDAAVTGVTRRDDIREVRNYVVALQHGVRRLKEDDFPISLRLIKEMHKILLTGVRGHDKTPGEFRVSQNWINSPDNRPDTATFVPPPVHEMWRALDDWEKYLHDQAPRLPRSFAAPCCTTSSRPSTRFSTATAG